MDSMEEMEAQIARLEKAIELERKRQELAALLSKNTVPDKEYETMESFQAALQGILERCIAEAEWSVPDNPNPKQFSQDWIAEGWGSRFRYMELTSNRFPHAIVQEALRELYERNGRNIESSGETAELYDSFRMTLEFRRLTWWRRWGKLLVSMIQPITPKKMGKKASEIRTSRQQHEIQRCFSALAVAFTFGTALFMTAMLAVGVVHLYNAVAQGVGFPVQIKTHEVFSVTSGNHESWPLHYSSVAKDHSPEAGANTVADPHKAMQTSLLALEIILVAPLPYLLVLGLTRYIKALAYQERADEFRRELLEFKAFEVALFIAIIAAAIVEKVLQNGLTYEFSISVVLVLAVLAGYYFIIEHASKSAAKEENH